MLPAHTWLWIKEGDHRSEAEELRTRFLTDSGEPAYKADVTLSRSPDDRVHTMIFADHPWWHEQMKNHPNGWRGVSFKDVQIRVQVP